MRPVNSFWLTPANHCRWNQGIPSGRITSTSATGSATCCWPVSPEPRKRSTQVTTQRTKLDWAHFIQHVVDVHSPQAEKMYWHSITCIRLPRRPCMRCSLPLRRVSWWRNWKSTTRPTMAVGPSTGRDRTRVVLSQHPLSQRIDTQAELQRQVEAWQQRCNQKAVTVDWRFTTEDARIKLKHLTSHLKERAGRPLWASPTC